MEDLMKKLLDNSIKSIEIHKQMEVSIAKMKVSIAKMKETIKKLIEKLG
jgi:hypothetical protein